MAMLNNHMVIRDNKKWLVFQPEPQKTAHWFHVGSAGSVAPLDRHQEGDEKNPWNTCQMATEEQPDQWSFQEPIYWRYLPYIRPI